MTNRIGECGARVNEGDIPSLNGPHRVSIVIGRRFQPISGPHPTAGCVSLLFSFSFFSLGGKGLGPFLPRGVNTGPFGNDRGNKRQTVSYPAIVFCFCGSRYGVGCWRRKKKVDC